MATRRTFKKGKYSYVMVNGVTVTRRKKGKRYQQHLLINSIWQQKHKLKPTDIRQSVLQYSLSDHHRQYIEVYHMHSLTKAEKLILMIYRD